MNDLVYWIGGDAFGPVKVGTTCDTRRRLRELQTGTHVPLVLLGSMPGGRDEELLLHRLLDRHRRKGEWFDRAAALDLLAVLGHRQSFGLRGLPLGWKHGDYQRLASAVARQYPLPPPRRRADHAAPVCTEVVADCAPVCIKSAGADREMVVLPAVWTDIARRAGGTWPLPHPGACLQDDASVVPVHVCGGAP